MTFSRLLAETLKHYRWTNLAVVLGSMIGSAILTGSLLVGDSMRGTLRDMTLERLGKIDLVHVGAKFFAADLDQRWKDDSSVGQSRAAAVLLLRGAAQGSEKQRADDVQIIGTTPAFWSLVDLPGVRATDASQEIIINRELAEELGATTGKRISLRLEKANDIPSEGLLGKREDTIKPVPLTVDRVIENHGAGRFSLAMTQRLPKTIFLPLERLAEAIGQKGRANALLVDLDESILPKVARDRLSNVLSVDDMGLSLIPAKSWMTIESRERILSPLLVPAIEQVIKERGYLSQRILTYLANAIKLAGQEVPYSVVVGVDEIDQTPFGPWRTEPAEPLLQNGLAIINQWTADRLGARIGSTIDLEYFFVRSDSSLEERTARVRVTAVAAMEGNVIDRTFTPDFPGITNADTFADWDAPFPVDLDRVKDEDEKYWKDFRTAPKVFLNLKEAQKLWGTRFGSLTSVRVAQRNGTPVDEEDLGRHLRSVINPETLGFHLEAIRDRDLKASSGSTDFGMLFLSMSFFLIISAAILVGLLFRLNTERRASSIGVMLATGSPPSLVRRWLLAEGSILSVTGSILGLLGAVVYARSLLNLLSTWWRDAVGTSFIEYHATPVSFVIGGLASVGVAMLAIAWATRRLGKVAIPQLLSAGFSFAPGSSKGPSRRALLLSLISLAAGGMLLLLGGSGAIDQIGAFFGGGALFLLGSLAGWAYLWSKPSPTDPASLVRGSGAGSIARLGIRNAGRYPSRSLLTATLIALAVFLVVSVGTMRHGKPASIPDRDSGNGGFALLARSTHPLLRSLADKDGRFALNVSDQAEKILAQSEVAALRVRPGDDASCLNVYQPTDPTILGVPPTMIERGGFAFASTLDPSAEEQTNPWLMLNREEVTGAIPAIGDAATLQWILKVPLGGELTTIGDDGKAVRLKIVGTLSESVFQGQLLIGEKAFVKLFPSAAGTRFFLIAPPKGEEAALAGKLEADLVDFGFDVETTAKVIEGYLAVQDTYMAAFQTLGGLGLALGTLGLGAVVLRNVLERKGELALLRAIGFSNQAISGLVLSETASLLVGGLFIGTLSAALAVLPALTRLKDPASLVPLGGTLLLILVAGLASSWFAVRAALASPIITALRSERA
jgi:ABC-type antimicrobial peptide transport system permease subunit